MKKTCLIILFFLGIISISQKTCAHPPRPGGKEPSFDYTDPAKWGSIGPEYKTCSSGKQQSPIDIDCKTASPSGKSPLTINYSIAEACLFNTGVAIQLSVKGKTEVTIGKVYRLLNLRWHTPSEHLIDGVQYDAEMHQVFVSNDKTESIAIVSTLYKVTPDVKRFDPVLNELREAMKQLVESPTATKDHPTREIEVDGKILPAIAGELKKYFPSDNYFRYMGSLTTPPCSELVTWIVQPKVQVISEGQLSMLHTIIEGGSKKNARPAQPLNGRVVQNVGKP